MDKDNIKRISPLEDSKITLRRPKEEPIEDKVDWAPKANDKLRDVMKEIREAIKGAAESIAKNGNSSTVTDADVVDARKKLYPSQKRQTITMLLFIASQFALVYCGYILQSNNLSEIIISSCLAITLLAFYWHLAIQRS